MWELIHCAKINLIFCKDTEPFVPGADVTVYVCPRNQAFSVAPAPTVMGSAFLQQVRLFLGQCAVHAN